MEEERNVELMPSFRVYDMPNELVNQYISYAKLYYGNKVWKVMELGMKLIRDTDMGKFDILDKVDELGRRVAELEEKSRETETQEEKKKFPSTLGGKK